MLDDRMNTESEIENDAPVWNNKANRAGWKMYLGDLFGSNEVPAYASPARATDYSNLPPAVTFVGSIEPFRDETIAYFENLQKAGVPAEIKICEGCYHAFDMMQPRAAASRQAVAFVLEKYQYAIENYSAKQPLNMGREKSCRNIFID
jgi:acetyl esterase/lipase